MSTAAAAKRRRLSSPRPATSASCRQTSPSGPSRGAGRGGACRARQHRNPGQQCRHRPRAPISSTSRRPISTACCASISRAPSWSARRSRGRWSRSVKAGEHARRDRQHVARSTRVFAIANQVPYSVSKGGINQLTKVMALSLAPYGIRVNAIGPGSIMTDMLASVNADPAAQNAHPVAHAARAHRRARRDRGDRRLPGLRRRQLHHRPDDLCRRRPAAAELHRAGERLEQFQEKWQRLSVRNCGKTKT